MGVNLSEIVPSTSASFETLAGKYIAVDAYNAIYQFLSVIRQPNGMPLIDSKGRITSHLAGLLYRNANLLEMGVLPVYVFDGIPHEMKTRTVVERSERRARAKIEWEEALRKGDYEVAFSKATQATRITNDIVISSKLLLLYLGIPIVQAPEEGEAQAAYMASKGDVWAASSQDFDSLLFGAPRLVRNLTLATKRKLPGRNDFKEINIEIIELEKVLNYLEITREQLIDLCILMGTDYNEGIFGIGPKKALKLIKDCGTIEKVFEKLGTIIPDYEKVKKIFENFERTDEYTISWKEVEKDKVIEFLCEEHDFSRNRVESALAKIETARLKMKPQQFKQHSLDHWW